LAAKRRVKSYTGGHATPVSALSFTADNKFIVSGAADRYNPDESNFFSDFSNFQLQFHVRACFVTHNFQKIYFSSPSVF
jgi:hypothetical protein